MNVLSLCSGIGGLDRGFQLAIPDARTVAYCEADPFCQDLLLRRQDDGWLDRAPIWPDLRTFNGVAWRGTVDGVVSGFPCQPFSTAGKRKGPADARNLWPDVRRVILESEPAIVILENVPGALPYFYHVVLPDLSGMGYATQAGLFTAAEVGAPHRRQRVFVLAVANARHGSRSTEQGGECEAVGAGAILVGRREESLDHPASPRHASGFAEAGGSAGAAWGTRESGGRRDAVGDPDNQRPQGRAATDEAGYGEAPDEFLPWPPGPAERDRWAAVLARWPDLAPALAVTDRRRLVGRDRPEAEPSCDGTNDGISEPDGGELEDPSRRGQRRSLGQGRRRREVSQASGELADPEDGRSRGSRRGQGSRGAAEGDEAEPSLRGMAARLPHRVDRLRALGNAVVPAQAAHAIQGLMKRIIL
jgi:DNA (cytosine-5)-methyltransferase 1